MAESMSVAEFREAAAKLTDECASLRDQLESATKDVDTLTNANRRLAAQCDAAMAVVECAEAWAQYCNTNHERDAYDKFVSVARQHGYTGETLNSSWYTMFAAELRRKALAAQEVVAADASPPQSRPQGTFWAQKMDSPSEEMWATFNLHGEMIYVADSEEECKNYAPGHYKLIGVHPKWRDNVTLLNQIKCLRSERDAARAWVIEYERKWRDLCYQVDRLAETNSNLTGEAKQAHEALEKENKDLKATEALLRARIEEQNKNIALFIKQADEARRNASKTTDATRATVWQEVASHAADQVAMYSE